MGLGMIEAMRVFDAERHEGIKMRVGIHTGELHSTTQSGI
jgi:adenylate cyclase 9